MNYTIKHSQKQLKTLNIKDPHFRKGFQAPKGREDDEFNQDIDDKITQIEKICKEEQIDLITISGDLSDIKEASRYTIKQLYPIHEILTRLREATRLKLILTIAGNHDLPNSSRGMKGNSVYDYFRKIGLITDIHNQELKIILPKLRVLFYGLDYNNKLSGLNKEIKTYHDNIKRSIKKTHYNLMIHEHLLQKKDLNKNETRFLGNRFTYGWVLKKYPKINCFISGHYHYGYPTYNKNGRVIINNWNLTRLARNYYVLNSQHIPNVVVTTYTQNGIKTKDIDLKVRDYVKAISEEDLDYDNSINIEAFIDKVENSKVSEEVVSDIVLNQRQQDLLNEILEEVKTEEQI